MRPIVEFLASPRSENVERSARNLRILLRLLLVFACLVGAIGVAWILPSERGGSILSRPDKDVVFDGKTFDDLAALEETVTAKADQRQLKQKGKEEREAFEKARNEAEIAWGKYKEDYLQRMKAKNVEREKLGKELYQDFVIPRGTATYMEYEVKVEDLKADVHDGGYRGKMAYRYFVPEIGEEKKVPLVLFLHSVDWQSWKRKDPWPPRNGTDNRYQFKSPEILAFVQPESQAKYPCFLVAPQQRNGGAWVSQRSRPNDALQNAVAIVDELIVRYPQIDTNRLYVTGGSAGGGWGIGCRRKAPE